MGLGLLRNGLPWDSSAMRSRIAILALMLLPMMAGAQQKEMPVTHHAHGTFSVNVAPLTPTPAEGISRYSINKEIHGDLEATTKGEMFGGGDFKTGAAGYVGIEEVTGTLAGKHGSFVLQHFATMDQSGQNMMVKIAPGSGTEDLKGIAGSFTIKIEGAQHSYDLDYTLPG